MSDNILVSIVCLTYNHEKYLRKALDSFISQKTSFNFEIIVHDDASTDKTVDIIKEYKEKYPNLLRVIYESKNQYSCGTQIFKDIILPIVRGKYVATCEGDDFWNDNNKLQLQFDLMEANENCSLCVHLTEVVDETGKAVGRTIPYGAIEEGIKDAYDVMSLIVEQVMPFQTSSFFYRRNHYRKFLSELPEFKKIADVGDLPLLLYLISVGNVFFVDKKLSSYRTMSIGSWSYRRNKMSSQNKIMHYNRMINMLDSYNVFTNGRFDSFIKLAKENYEWSKLLTLCFTDYDKNAAKLILKNDNKKRFDKMDTKSKFVVRIVSIFPAIMRFQRKIRNIFKK